MAGRPVGYFNYEHDQGVEQESIEKQLQFVVRMGLKPVTSEFQVQLATNLKNEVKLSSLTLSPPVAAYRFYSV